MELRQEIARAAESLLKEVDRASKESKCPMKIATAIGILLQKKAKGFEVSAVGRDLSTEGKRGKAYDELLKKDK